MRIVVVGARGQLAAALIHECRDRHEAIAFDRAALDVTDDKVFGADLYAADQDWDVQFARNLLAGAADAVVAGEDWEIEGS